MKQEALTSSRWSLLSISSSSSSFDSFLSFFSSLQTGEVADSCRCVAPCQPVGTSTDWAGWRGNAVWKDQKDIQQNERRAVAVHLFCARCQQDPVQRWSGTGWSEAAPSSSLCSLSSAHSYLFSPFSEPRGSPPLAYRCSGPLNDTVHKQMKFSYCRHSLVFAPPHSVDIRLKGFLLVKTRRQKKLVLDHVCPH